MSGSLKITLKFDASGPLADGRAVQAAEDWTESTSQALADAGLRMLRDFPMNKTGRARGGFENALQVVRKNRSETSVPGPMREGVAWSPWLEGTSKRNEGSTFKGYGLFAKTRTELRKRAPQIGQEQLDKLMPEIGGD